MGPQMYALLDLMAGYYSTLALGIRNGVKYGLWPRMGIRLCRAGANTVVSDQDQEPIRIWILTCRLFLNVGISPGSWWAHHELGRGGWWFWRLFSVNTAYLIPSINWLSLGSSPNPTREWTGGNRSMRNVRVSSQGSFGVLGHRAGSPGHKGPGTTQVRRTPEATAMSKNESPFIPSQY
jgi:hypothetical protein